MLLKPDDKDIERTISRGIILTITLVAAALLILNVVLISFYVKRRAKKQMMSGTITTGSTVTNGKLILSHQVLSNFVFLFFFFYVFPPCVRFCCISTNLWNIINPSYNKKRYYSTCQSIKTRHDERNRSAFGGCS
jgi:hypothetical protein